MMTFRNSSDEKKTPTTMNGLQLFGLSLFAMLFSGCFFGNENPENDFFEDEAYYGKEEEYVDDSSYREPLEPTQSFQNSTKEKKMEAQEKLRNFENRDQKTGMISSTIPFPASWRQIQNNNEWTFEGPNGLKVSGSFGQQFFYGGQPNPYSDKYRNPMGIQQIIDEFFMPTAERTQRTLISTYELPKVAAATQAFRDQLWQYAPTQKTTKAYGMEWKDPQGMHYLTVLNVTDDRSPLGNNWMFYGQFIQAKADDFEEAKKAFLYGIINTKYNPQWIAAFNQRELQRANISDAAHRKRLAAINARGQATLDLGKTYSEISDISHAGYLNRSNMNSHGHSKTISGINETVTIANHGTGEHYSVPMGTKHYWVSNDGTYFGTNNTLYNPNTDKRMYDKEWTQFEVEQ
ncbi:hypothetical protein [Luteirhabdus pelagi]|uniref:hypothetical protein n=1 Tax=Luteirhabdus pelagi TaxID=2792783 RepID=UPI00193AC49D|nr:hypothetical protein [Luteirhabdus pelagi]